MELNLKDLKRPTLKITFPDDKVISVLPPKKSFYDSLDALEGLIELAEAEEGNDLLTVLYKALAEVLSNNSEQEKITVKYLESIADLEILNYLVYSYRAFCEEVSNAKNWLSPSSH